MKRVQILAVVVLVAACAPGQDVDPTPRPVAQSTAAPFPAETRPQRLCYVLEDATLTSGVRLTVGAGSRVVGETYSTIHNEAASYFAFYRQTHEGSLSGETMMVTTFTEIEYDEQTSLESWVFSPDRLVRDELVYPAADCETVDARFADVSD